MTKLRWDKADHHEPDPAKVVEVSESTRPSGWFPPDEQRRRAGEKAKRHRDLKARSEQHDAELLAAGLERQIRAQQERGEPLSAWDEMFLKRRKER